MLSIFASHLSVGVHSDDLSILFKSNTANADETPRICYRFDNCNYFSCIIGTKYMHNILKFTYTTYTFVHIVSTHVHICECTHTNISVDTGVKLG
jgi:hypothetical protein